MFVLLPDPHDSLLQIVFQIVSYQTSPEWRCFILFRVPSLLCLFFVCLFFSCSYNHLTHYVFRCGLSRWFSGKESTCKCKRHERFRFDPWIRKIPWRRKWQPPPIFLPRKFHGQRSLGGHSPWGHKGLDPTEHTRYIRVSWLLSLGCPLLAGNSLVLFSTLSTVPRIRPVGEQALINTYWMN